MYFSWKLVWKCCKHVIDMSWYLLDVLKFERVVSFFNICHWGLLVCFVYQKMALKENRNFYFLVNFVLFPMRRKQFNCKILLTLKYIFFCSTFGSFKMLQTCLHTYNVLSVLLNFEVLPYIQLFHLRYKANYLYFGKKGSINFHKNTFLKQISLSTLLVLVYFWTN